MKTASEIVQEYLDDVDRYLLVTTGSVDLSDAFCMIYDTKHKCLHWIDNDVVGGMCIRQLREAGARVVSKVEFDEYSKPIHDYFDQAIFDRVPMEEIQRRLLAFPCPFRRQE